MITCLDCGVCGAACLWSALVILFLGYQSAVWMWFCGQLLSNRAALKSDQSDSCCRAGSIHAAMISYFPCVYKRQASHMHY